ncbi:hypothetical protein JUJ52_09205 [Virgibacillus sp. AGTR]|uniref:hypothetical protein n=1 Tax=Virgibacillus sp. AGTR TaxID=2812055 RepID=UPI001966702D|nr:hypothetical protein [Virgibacillus sp. AGTR]MCC2250144.1 hypothetical protein [Virgibacillus sp. AGTR]QRZ19027.1 hypothetical protein JUJ52_04695 [Virgibacillus sp. AGTR]
MELVSLFHRKEKKKRLKLRETKFGIASFICALLTLAYLNIFLLTFGEVAGLTNIFFGVLPFLGTLFGLISLTRMNFKKTFTLLAFSIYVFTAFCIVIVGFFELSIYPKP